MSASPSSPAQQVAQQWLKTAEHDLAVVQALNADPDEAYLSAICFHAQQCVEKAIKAVLVLRGSDVPRTHDLETLTDLVTKAGVATVGIERVRLATLTEYAVETRYADGTPPTPAEAKAAASDAVTVLETLRPFLLAAPEPT